MKILSLTIGLLLIATMAVAEPVYTEGVSYQVEVTETGFIQVRRATRVYKDGVEISKSYHRHVLAPEADLTNEVKKVKDIAEVVWTEAVVEEYLRKRLERKEK